MVTFPATYVAGHFGQCTANIQKDGYVTIVTKFGKPAVAIISIEDLDCLISGRQVQNPALEAALKELEADIAAIRAASA